MSLILSTHVESLKIHCFYLCFFLLNQQMFSLLTIPKYASSSEAVEYVNCTFAEWEEPRTTPPVVVMLQDGILVADLSSSGQVTGNTQLWPLLG